MSAAKKILPIAPTAPAPTGAMISKTWDIVLVGGLSVAMFVLMCVTFPSNSPDSAVALYVFNLSFIMNFPHFLASYQMLYGDFRHELFRSGRFFWAGVIVPTLLAGGMIACFLAGNPVTLGYFVAAMYFFVGWHYVKQTFGVMVVSNAYKKIFYNEDERFWLKANLYSIWGISFFTSNVAQQNYQQMGIIYPSMNLGYTPLYVCYTMLGMTGAMVLWTHLQKYIREGKTPTPAAMMAYFTIHVWLLPGFTHAMFGHMIPFFHSLQYLPFVFLFRKNKVEDEIENIGSPEGRKQWLLGVPGFFIASVMLGALSFYIVPGIFDNLGYIDRAKFGPTPFVFFATIFINIHHYFIDNVIWRGDNAETKKYLFKAG